MTSKAAREAAKRADDGMDALLQKHHAKLVLDIHLDPTTKRSCGSGPRRP